MYVGLRFSVQGSLYSYRISLSTSVKVSWVDLNYVIHEMGLCMNPFLCDFKEVISVHVSVG